MSSALPPATPSPRQTPVRSIILLAAAGFASQAQVRVTDSLLPSIASDFQTTVGVAAMVLTAYALTHGSIQFVVGPMADRFGKYRTVAIASVLAAVLVSLCGAASSLPQLAFARLATGAVAGWVIPVSMAYLGDVTPADRLQPILARYASGYILGQLFGQAMGGVLGDLFGWRNVFFALGGMFALAAAGLIFELIVNQKTRERGRAASDRRGFAADYAAVLSNPFARIILIMGFCEAALAWGAFAYIGADLHQRFGRPAGDRRLFDNGGLHRPHLATGMVAGPDRDDGDWARFLHVPQHAADQGHADDAGGAGHRGGDLLFRALFRSDRGRRGGRSGHRPVRRGAALSRHRRLLPGAGVLVCL